MNDGTRKELHRSASISILHAEMSRARGDAGAAQRLFAEAAVAEERLAAGVCTSDRDEYGTLLISAASCWAEANRRADAERVLETLRALPVTKELESSIREVRLLLEARKDAPRDALTVAFPSDVRRHVPTRGAGPLDPLVERFAAFQKRQDTRPDIRALVVFGFESRVGLWAQAACNGITLACFNIYETGGPLIALRRADNRSDPGRTRKVIADTLRRNDVDIIVGPISSAEVIRAVEAATNRSVPLVAPAATASTIRARPPDLFRVCFADEHQAKTLAEKARVLYDPGHVVLACDPNDAYSASLADAIESHFNQPSVRVSRVTMCIDDVKFRTQAQAIRNARPNVAFILGRYPEVGRLVADSRRAGYRGPFFAGDAADEQGFFDYVEPTGDCGHGKIFVTTHFWRRAKRRPVAEFVDAYNRLFSQSPTVAAALAYDTILLIGRAWRERGRGTLANALGRVQGVDGVTGHIDMGEDGHPKKKGVLLLEAKNGAFTLAS